jgi:hypothetical protein
LFAKLLEFLIFPIEGNDSVLQHRNIIPQTGGLLLIIANIGIPLL